MSPFHAAAIAPAAAAAAEGAMAVAFPGDGRFRFELRYPSLYQPGRARSFPCDACGQVFRERLSERGRQSLDEAQAGVGIEFAMPCVQVAGLH